MRIETVEIKGKDGSPTLINKTDFDSKKHTLCNEPIKRGPKPKENTNK